MVGNIKYIVRLSTSEREALEGLVNKGKVAAAKRKRAHILLKADANAGGPAWTDEQIAEALDVSVATIHRTRQAYVAQGLAVSLERQRPTGRQFRKLDGAQEARLVAIACSPAPEGYARWTLTLLADKLVTLEIVEAIGKETVRRTLKKTTSSRG
jgi:transposase